MQAAAVVAVGSGWTRGVGGRNPELMSASPSTADSTSPFLVVWPQVRFPDPQDVEIASVAPHGEARFFASDAEVPDEVWATADAIVSATDVPDGVRSKLERCRIMVTHKVGFDNIDVDAWAGMGVPVCNVPDYGTQEVADHALALLLSLVRSIPMHDRRLRADPVGNWDPRRNPLARRMSTSVCGIVGLGRIGTAFALRAKALGMDVVFYDPYRPNGADLALNIRRARSLGELFAESDVVSVHVPLSAETDGLIGAEVMAAAKPGLVLINTARGPVVDLDALYDALRSGSVGGAGLDVLPEEPANTDRPLIRAWVGDEEWLRDRLLITPHSAFCTPGSVTDMRRKGGEVAMRYLVDGVLENCVNEHLLTDRR